jgi:hypothetical protein
VKVKCVWEHNGNDTLLYAVDYVGAYTRGDCLDVALRKMNTEMASYCAWKGKIPWQTADMQNLSLFLALDKVRNLR